MIDNATHFYIVRHGKSEGNAQNIIQGHTESPLSTIGEVQARELGNILRNVPFDLAYSSDLVRTKRTAEIVLLERALAVNTTKLLREHNMGTWERRNTDEWREKNKELLEKYETLSENEKWKARIPDGVENDEEVSIRLMRFLRETAVTYPEKNILVATHGGVMRCLLVRLGYGTHAELPIGSVENAGLIRVDTDGVAFEIVETRGVTTKRKPED